MSGGPEGRTALVTGASAGIGAAFARVLAAEGLDLVLVARRADRLETLARDLEGEFGITATALAADLCVPGAVDQMKADLAARHIQVDVLVNNAGFACGQLSAGGAWETHRVVMEVMATAVVHACHAFLPGMIERGYGRIINVSSVSGWVPTPEQTLYAPVKAFLTMLSESLNLELRGRNIHVSALCPGYTRTEFHAVAGLTQARKGIPNFMWMTAERVARDGLKAVMAGKSVCVPGLHYKIIVWLLTHFPFLRTTSAMK